MHVYFKLLTKYYQIIIYIIIYVVDYLPNIAGYMIYITCTLYFLANCSIYVRLQITYVLQDILYTIKYYILYCTLYSILYRSYIIHFRLQIYIIYSNIMIFWMKCNDRGFYILLHMVTYCLCKSIVESLYDIYQNNFA